MCWLNVRNRFQPVNTVHMTSHDLVSGPIVYKFSHVTVSVFPFIALMLLVRQHEGYPAGNNLLHIFH